MRSRYPILTAQEAAALIQNGQLVAFGGFTTGGNPAEIGLAIAARAEQEHAAGRDFQIGNIGVANAPGIEGALANAGAVSFRTGCQSSPAMRSRINGRQTRYSDQHLSHLPQAVRYGFLGRVDWAIVQAADITDDGEILLTSAVGGAPSFCTAADRILVELNSTHPKALLGFHDVYEPADPPNRREIPIYKAEDLIGTPLMKVDPKKIAGIVLSDMAEAGTKFDAEAGVTGRIGRNVAEFLANEMAAGRVPRTFLPIQSGVGNIANAVLGALGANPDIPPFAMFTEVVQESVLALLKAGRVRFASCCGLTLSSDGLRDLYSDLESFRGRLLIRPQEITNHPEVIRRLGLISMNTALEADIYGNVNSTHVLGQNMMNGIGGSGDFTRNAYISIFSCPSTAKGGKISAIVPMVSHVDHTEHSVQALATEYGVADLRGISPQDRAERIIKNCAHPDYRDLLREYVSLSKAGHTAHALRHAFSFHERFEATGNMRKASETAA